MEYKGYIGKVDFDDEAGVFHGEVINTRDVITRFQKESRTKWWWLKKLPCQSDDGVWNVCYRVLADNTVTL